MPTPPEEHPPENAAPPADVPPAVPDPEIPEDAGEGAEPAGEPETAGETEAAAAPEPAEDSGASRTPSPSRSKGKTFPPVPPDRLSGAVEALLLASGDVVTVERLRDLLGLNSVIHIREALAEIEARWAEAGLAVEVHEVAGGVRVVTRPEFAEYVRRLSRRPEVDRLTPSLLETLSIVAYRQPVPRLEVERIRGVQCGDALRGLLERRLLKVAGRSDQPGRPLLYGTTRRFLEIFGLRTLKDLPAKGDLKRL